MLCTSFLLYCFQNKFLYLDISLKRIQESVRPDLSPEPTKLMIISFIMPPNLQWKPLWIFFWFPKSHIVNTNHMFSILLFASGIKVHRVSKKWFPGPICEIQIPAYLYAHLLYHSSTQLLPFSNTHLLKYSNMPSLSGLTSSCTPIPTNQKIHPQVFMRLSPHHSSLSSNVIFSQRTSITMQSKLVLPGTLYPTSLFYFFLRTYHTFWSYLVLLCIVLSNHSSPVPSPTMISKFHDSSFMTARILTVLFIVISPASGTQ